MLSTQATNVIAIGVLAAAGLSVVVWVIVGVMRSPFTPVQTALWAFNYAMTRILWRTRLSGRVSVAPGEGAVIVCNHRSPIDPSFIMLATDRGVHWMVAKEYCERPLMGWLLRTCEVISTNRTGIDTAATRQAIRCASEGGLVGVFPEGRINTTDELLLPGRPGAAMIALKARVPVVPCYVSGSPYDGTTWGYLFMPAKVRLEVGRPIDISDLYGRENEREVLKELTRRFLCEIARLAGRPDFQPQLAGRFHKPDAE